MNDRLYYTDPFLREFDATVERVETRAGRPAVTLDRTAFYPTSGGQPFDTGVLGPFRVVDVVDEDDGAVWHVLEASADAPAASSPAPGQALHGIIDWDRRLDHMQQHSGQHVLSAAFERLFHIRTVSFHLGADVSTIDLAREASADQIAAAENEANRVVWEDRPVSIRFASAEEAARLPLRKEPVRGGTLRLIEVLDFDLSACGGTHVARTGTIGMIAVAGWERFKGGQRIEFVCGGRALRTFRAQRDTVTASIRLLSVLPQEIPESIERLQADAKEQRRVTAALQQELARFRAEELAAGAEPCGTVKLVAAVIDADANALKSIAAAVTSRPGLVAALFSTKPPLLAAIARSAGVDISAQRILSALVDRFGGRGGGRPELAQGGGLGASADELVRAVRDVVAIAQP